MTDDTAHTALVVVTLAARVVTERFHGVVFRARLTLLLPGGATRTADDDARLSEGWAERTRARVALLGVCQTVADVGAQRALWVPEADVRHVHPHLVGVGLCIVPTPDGPYLTALRPLPASFTPPGAADWLLAACWPQP